MGWTDEEWLFETRQGQELYLFFTASRAVRGPRVAAGGWGADHSPPFSTQFKNEWGSSTHPYTFVLRAGDILSLLYLAEYYAKHC